MKVIFDDEEQKKSFVKNSCVRWFNIDVGTCLRSSDQSQVDCMKCMSEYVEMEVKEND